MRRIVPSLLSGLTVLAASWMPVGAQKPPSMPRCLQLMAQFDRYYPRNGEGTGSTGSRLDRGVAEVQCRRGEYAEGIRTLEAAMRRNLIAIPSE